MLLSYLSIFYLFCEGLDDMDKGRWGGNRWLNGSGMFLVHRNLTCLDGIPFMAMLKLFQDNPVSPVDVQLMWHFGRRALNGRFYLYNCCNVQRFPLIYLVVLKMGAALLKCYVLKLRAQRSCIRSRRGTRKYLNNSHPVFKGVCPFNASLWLQSHPAYSGALHCWADFTHFGRAASTHGTTCAGWSVLCVKWLF